MASAPRRPVTTAALGGRAVLAAMIAALAMAGASAASQASLAADDAVAWMVAHRGDVSDGLAAHLVEAAAARGHDPALWPTDRPLLDDLAWPSDRAVLVPLLRPSYAWLAAGRDLGATPVGDVRATLEEAYQEGRTGESALLNDDVWALRLLARTGPQELVGPLAAHVASSQQADGGWSWRPGGASDTDMTGMALVALAEAGALEPHRAAAAADHLLARRDPYGLFAASGGDGGQGNCNSSVWALRGLAAAGHEGAAMQAWRGILALQRGPAFAYRPDQQDPSPLCTAEVATALALAAGGGLPEPGGSAIQTTPAAPAVAAAVVALWTLSRRRTGYWTQNLI